MMGFMQMGSSLAGGAVAALLGDPVLAMATVIPSFGLVAILSYLAWRTLPTPALSNVTVEMEMANEPPQDGSYDSKPGRSKSPVSLFITHNSPVEMSNQAPCSVSRPLPSRMFDTGKGAQVGDGIADRDALKGRLALGAGHQRVAGHGLGRRRDEAHPAPHEIARDSGPESGVSAARMPPHRPWPITTICRTLRLCTANSSAAEVEWNSPSGA